MPFVPNHFCSCTHVLIQAESILEVLAKTWGFREGRDACYWSQTLLLMNVLHPILGGNQAMHMCGKI